MEGRPYSRCHEKRLIDVSCASYPPTLWHSYIDLCFSVLRITVIIWGNIHIPCFDSYSYCYEERREDEALDPPTHQKRRLDVSCGNVNMEGE